MKKISCILFISLLIYACSHKTTATATVKTSSATVTHEQYLEGKMVYEASCATCHKLKAPERYTATAWVKWIDKMAPRAKINDEQKAQIYKYVSVNAKGS